MSSGIKTIKTRLSYVSEYEMGFSKSINLLIDSIVNSAIDLKVFPGCQILIAKKGKVFYKNCKICLSISDSLFFSQSSIRSCIFLI